MERTYKEYGGFLPLELMDGNEYYENYAEKTIRFNCAKAAIAHVLNKIEADTIYVPSYLCPNVCAEIEKHKIAVTYYSINEQLLPPDIPDSKNCCVYVVDYFGIMDRAIEKYVAQFSDATVIIDNSHAFFHLPIIASNVFNVYSCKKFFGVPDGAYLIAETVDGYKERVAYSGEHANYLLQCAERGTNDCYTEKKAADLWLAQNLGPMSVLARKILRSIHYEEVKKRRKENLAIYRTAFDGVNFFHPEQDSVPYIFPLNTGKNVKETLIKQKIYVPTLWGHLVTDENRGSFEYWLSDKTLFLPLDQRYGENDMKFIAERVKEALT